MHSVRTIAMSVRAPTDRAPGRARPVGVVSRSPGAPGALGGFGANHHLRQCLVCLDVPALAPPEGYLSPADMALDGGEIADARVREFLADFMVTFAQEVERPCPKDLNSPDRAIRDATAGTRNDR